jgi:MYXO-CTERM domain-containing protein
VCSAARFAVDEYSLVVPGDWAVAIHVIDGLAASDQAAEVGSLNDDNFDPAPKKNAGVIGAAVYRGSKQTYVVASSAQDGAAGAMLTYSVPGGSAARHIVYDAPEASDATSSVTSSVDGDRCTLSIQAGSGGGITGHPLMFQVGPASGGCTVKEDTDVPAASPPPGGGITPIGGSGGTGSSSGGSSASNGGSSNGGSSNGGSSNGGATNSRASNGGSDTAGSGGGDSVSSSSDSGGCNVGHGERRHAPLSVLALAFVALATRRRRQARA